MNPQSPLPVFFALIMAVLTSFLLLKRFGAPIDHGRYSSIDGLRGYLAFFVFLHHACLWFFYLRSGQWQMPPSNLYTQLGKGSVAIFFMITGFLFFLKLLHGRSRNIDWGKLFISRFLRLVPLYLFAMLLLFLIVAVLSNYSLNESVPKLLKEATRWLGFTVLGMPNVNAISQTFIIVAGVTWSLPYEWFFYFALPVLALAVRVIPPYRYIAFSIACCAGMLIIWHPNVRLLLPFLGGITAAFLVQSKAFCQFAARRVSSFIALACIALVVAFYESPFENVPIFLLSVVFTLIACGNSLFGILISPVSRVLGEMAYSIYLLHGITLFSTFKLILGTAQAKTFSPEMHWLIAIGITPLLLFLSFTTFRYIESPAMRFTPVVNTWLRSRLIKNLK